jgi:hypothetical protein
MPDLGQFTQIARTESSAGRIWTNDQEGGGVERSKRGFFGKHGKISPADQARNKETVQAFKEALTTKFGAEISDFAFPGLKDQLDAGKPLSAKQITHTVKAAVAFKKLQVQYNSLVTRFNGKADKGSPHVPRSDQIKDIAGKPGIKSSTYKGVLQALDNFHAADKAHTQGNITKGDLLEATLDLAEKTKDFRNKKMAEMQSKAGSTGAENRIMNRLKGMAHIEGQVTLKLAELTGHDLTASGFVPGEERSSVENFAGGNMAQVAKVTYRDGSEGIFKPTEKSGDMKSVVGMASGIPNQNSSANLTGRAVASSKLGELLGGDLVPKTDYAVHNGNEGCTQLFAKGKPLFTEMVVKSQKVDLVDIGDKIAGGIKGALWESHRLDGDEIGRAALKRLPLPQEGEGRAELLKLAREGHVWMGEEFAETMTDIDFSLPAIQKGMSDAQILDLLCGQVDRNPYNIIYQDTGDGGMTPRLIDNDLAFGSQFNTLSGDNLEAMGGYLPNELPRLIDAATAEKITGISEGNLRGALAGTGLTTEELDAAVGRLQSLKGHIGAIQAGNVEGGQIVETWNDETFEAQATSQDNYLSKQMYARTTMTFQSPNAGKILHDSLIFGEGRLLRDAVLTGGARGTFGNHLMKDIAQGGEVFKAMLNDHPQALFQQVSSLPLERQSELISAFRLNVHLDTPAEAAKAADLAKQITLAQVNNGRDGEPLTEIPVESFNMSTKNMVSMMGQAFSMETFSGVLHQAFENGSLVIPILSDLIQLCGPTIGMATNWSSEMRGELNDAALKTLPQMAPFYQAEATNQLGETGADLIVVMGKTYEGLMAGASDQFVNMLKMQGSVNNGIQAYNAGHGQEVVSWVDQGFASELAKLDQTLMDRFNGAEDDQAVADIAQEQGWVTSEGSAAHLKANKDEAAKDFMARFVAQQFHTEG